MQKLNYILVGLLCLPVLFVNVKNTHDWGDDFAQYIHQAKNISEGKSQAETGYVYNEDNFLGPPAYPIGFPLLLAPVYALCGNSIHAFSMLISVSLYFLCFLLFYFFRKYFSSLVSILLILIFIYNPWTFLFKLEVMSEIPFTLFLVLSVLLYLNVEKNKYNIYILALVGGYLISIRNIGFVLPMAVLLDALRLWYRARKYGPVVSLRPLLVRSSIILSGILCVYALFSLILFPLPSGIIAYPHLADASNFKNVLLKNLDYNIAVLQAFFSHYDVHKWVFVQHITKSAMLIFLIVGLLKKITSGIGFLDLLVLCYIGGILVFPYGDAGFRFLLPVFPFFLYYVVIGLQSLQLKLPISKSLVAFFLGAAVLIQYKVSDEGVWQTQQNTIAGPLEPESVEAFQYIREHTPSSAVIAFCKPRAMALYTDRKGIANSESYTPEECSKKFQQAGVSYYLVHTEITDEAMKNFLKQNEGRIKLLWSNSKMSLYQ